MWTFAAPPASAHAASDAYLTLVQSADGRRFTGRWDIALRDLEPAIGLDADGDGAITWGEVRARHADIAAYAASRLKLAADGAECGFEPDPRPQQIEAHGDGHYTVLRFAFACSAAARSITLAYSLFADTDPLHRGLLNLQTGAGARSAVLDPLGGPQRYDVAEISHARQFLEYLGQGVWHIWIGIDHILFLVALLLPSVLLRERERGGRWRPVPRLRAAFVEVLKVVTGFTVAHSITLTLATLGILTLPSRPVESVIAASVVLAALFNVLPRFDHGRRWLVAFGFGLIHGFGFAGALAELGLPQGALALALFGFNLGVEVGQLAIVAVFLPLAFALRRTPLYQRGVMVGGSIAIAAVAALWFVERAFGVQLPLF